MLEADHLQKRLKSEEEGIEGGSNADNNFSEKNGHLNKRLKSFSCEEPGCGKSYGNRDNLKGHTRSEHGSAKLKCGDSSCTAEFSFQRDLNRHVWVKHGVGKGLKCDKCGKRQSSSFCLKDHMRAFHGAPEIQCGAHGCDATFKYCKSRTKHMRTKHSESNTRNNFSEEKGSPRKTLKTEEGVIGPEKPNLGGSKTEWNNFFQEEEGLNKNLKSNSCKEPECGENDDLDSV